MMKLIEECSGHGELLCDGRPLRPIEYRVQRYQGIVEDSGLPIPGLFRIEGNVGFDAAVDSQNWLGTALGLKLADGRVLGITIVDESGRILSEGHGPSKCRCC